MPETTTRPEAATVPGVRVVSGLTFDKARDLLDWLEANGVQKADAEVEDSGLVTVRWEQK
jgi:hypothetical protein